jgi:hypothetical protein
VLRKVNRRIAVVAAVAVVGTLFASMAVFARPAYAATIAQNPPTSATVTTTSSFPFSQQINVTGNTGLVTFVQTTGTPNLTVDSTGLVSTSATLAVGSYTATGTDSTTFPDSGTFTFTLTVTAVAITQTAPTAGSVATAGWSAFTAQLNTIGGNGAVTFAKTGGPASLVVSSIGVISTTGGSLGVGTYPINGTTNDAFGDTGTFTYTLTVTASTLTQTAPTTGAVTNPGSAAFADQLHVSGNVGAVSYTKTGGSGLNVSSTGAITTIGSLSGSAYTATGTDIDTLGNIGTFSYTLTVTAVLPTAPTIQTATAGNNSATVRWAAPANDGGSAITGYLITPSIGSPVIVIGNVTKTVVTGLSDGVAYTFTVAAINGVGTGPASGPSNSITPSATGYWLVASDGGIFTFGQQLFYGSTGAIHLNQPIVGMASTPDGGGYWLVASDGGIFAFGNAGFFGSTGAIHLNQPIVGMASTPDGGGYWLVASDGGIFAFGNAKFHGSTGAIHLNQPIVGMATTPQGNGYWLVASDGGIFAFGTAAFYGSTGAIHLNRPIVGMASTTTGKGYWMVASDGGIFAFGDAAFYGSTGAIHLNRPIVGMDATPKGKGYWLVASDGGIFSFGDAAFFGSTGARALNKPIVGIG